MSNDQCSCFNCNLIQYPCINYGTCNNGTGICECPVGFGGPGCEVAGNPSRLVEV